jgi:16S rRNA (cytosine967-C5)-methyltransferase
MEFLKPSLDVLKRFYNDPGKNLKLILSGKLDKIKDHHKHQAITRTVYGVVRNHQLLEYLVQKISQRKLKKIQLDVLVILKIGIYLLIFSKSYPDYAVVNEVVKTAKAQTKSFVNALLRNITTNKTTIMNHLENIRQLNITYSVPDILIDNLKLISNQLEENLEYLNQEPRFHIRVNQKDYSYIDARLLLKDSEISARELKKFYSFEIKQSGQVINRLLTKPRFYFQDTGSQLVSIIASQFARKKVLDCCAAPGTKSVTLSLLNPQLTIYANDINPKRVKLLKDFQNQYDLTRINPVVSDIKRVSFKKDIDFIIVDAPCTSSGTLRKNPDLKIKINSDLINKNTKNQCEIMESITSYFPGPLYILYSVCSFIKEETEGVMERLFDKLSLADRFEIIDLTLVLEEYGFLFKRGGFGYYLLPSKTLNNDMFYISLLKSHSPSSLKKIQ